MLEFFLLAFFSSIFSLTISFHFLGGSFTYRHIEQSSINYRIYETVLVEIRFHISDHYFICTSDDINEHMVVYLLGESVLYDHMTQQYLWFNTESIRKNKNFYNIECLTMYKNSGCSNFQEKIWGYCESVNKNSGYSIIRRQFLFIIEKFRPIQLRYSACCWANSTDKYFYFDLSIESRLNRNNSSPYPHIPASYYVDFNQPREIKIFAYDIDGDEIICEPFADDFNGFLTVHVNFDCKLNYKTTQIGKQFGQFWLTDQNKNRILSRTLISIQVHVLKEIICDIQPELIIKTKENVLNKSIININQSIYLSVRTNPNCLLIEPQDQTITELTTLCTNNQPIILANGGIEVIFQCTPYLCENYHICFVGEFGLKLPATKIQCFIIEVTGTKEECEKATSNYDFLKPRNRHFIISEPINEQSVETVTKSTIFSSIKMLKTTGSIKSTRLPLKLSKTTTTSVSISSTTSLSLEPPSRRWLSILIALVFFLSLGAISFCGIKELLTRFNRHSRISKQSRSSKRSGSYSTIKSTRNTIDTDMTPTNTPSPYESTPILSAKKVRSQHLRLGALEMDNY